MSLAALAGDCAEISATAAMVSLARSSGKELEDLLTKAAGRPITLVIRGPDGSAQAGVAADLEAKGPPVPDIRQHPLVKATEELFGARVVRVEARTQPQ